MFDLFRSREKNVRWLLGALLGLVALSMVITLVPNYSGLGGQADKTVIASIGDDTISATDVRQTISRASRGGQIPRGLEQVYAPMLIQQMIAEHAITYEAARLGMTVSEKELAESIQSYLPQLFQDGKFAGKEAYTRYLAQVDTTIPEFERDLKKQILMQRLESLALEGIVVTPAQVEEEFRSRSEKIRVAYFRFTTDAVKSKVTATPDELKDYFKKFGANYNLPEKRDYLAFAIDEDKVAAAISVSDSDLRRAYADNLERFRVQERVKVSHILLKTTGKPPAEVQAIRKRMDDLLKQVKGGGNFAELARKNSEDSASAVRGGDINWIARGQTVPEFEKAAFTLKPGEISDVITTVYGFHILKVAEREQAHLQPFEEVKDQLLAAVRRGRSMERMQTLGDELRAALQRSPAEAEKLAAGSGIQPVRAMAVAAGGEIPGVGSGPQLNDALTGLKKGGVTPALSVSPTRLAVVQLLDSHAARQAELAEVQDQVKEAVLSAKAQKLVQDQVSDADKRLKSGEEFAAVAKQLGVEVKSTSTAFDRNGAAEGIGAASGLELAFKKQVGEVAGPIATTGGSYFLKVLDRTEANLADLPAQRDQIVGSIKGRVARDRRQMFSDGLVDALVKSKKLKIYEDNIKRLTAAYRG